MLASTTNKWREETMRKSGDNALRTVESLRGRLLAERATSRTAKAEVDLLSKRLEELESQLAEEIKSRDRAEKRLKNALEKLESFKASVVSRQLKNLTGSSVSSSSACLSSFREPDCQKQVEFEERDSSGATKETKETGSVSSSPASSHQSVSQEGSWTSVETEHSHNNEEFEKVESKSLESITVRKSPSTEDQQRDDEGKENCLALVPMGSDVSKPDMKSNRAEVVLLTLRRVKEQIQSSLAQRALLSSPIEICIRQTSCGCCSH